MHVYLPVSNRRFACLLFYKIPRSLWVAAAIFAVGLVSGCDKYSHKKDEASGPVMAVQAQINALNMRDAAGAVALMHPQAAGREKALETTQKLFNAYDLLFMVQNVNLEFSDETEAKVRFTQVTHQVSKKTDDADFRNNRVVGIHTLRKDAGEWKIYSTQVEKIEYFDQMPRATPLRE